MGSFVFDCICVLVIFCFVFSPFLLLHIKDWSWTVFRFVFSLTEGFQEPKLRFKMADVRPERLKRADLRPERPNLRSERPGLRPERLELRPKRANLKPEMLDLRPESNKLRPRWLI